jgi:hypothetical protein
MKLIDRITVGKEVFTDRGFFLTPTRLLERLASAGGFSYPLPQNIHVYYFMVEDCSKMVVEYYIMEKERD